MEGALQDLLLELPAAPMDKKGFIASFSAVGLRERALSSRSEPSFSQMLLEKKQAEKLEASVPFSSAAGAVSAASEAASSTKALHDAIAAVHQSDTGDIMAKRRGRERSQRANAKARHKKHSGESYSERLKSRVGSRDTRKSRMQQFKKQY